MTTLSDAVARVLRRELAADRRDITDFGRDAGKTKTTAWRQIVGESRMSIDDVEAYATALGWSLDRLLNAALAERAEMDKPAGQDGERPIRVSRARVEGRSAKSSPRTDADVRPGG